MLRNKYSVGDVVRVSQVPTRDYDGSVGLKFHPAFDAKIKYIDDKAIAVEIDQWWVFFDRYGSQLECDREGFCAQYVLLDPQ